MHDIKKFQKIDGQSPGGTVKSICYFLYTKGNQKSAYY